MVTDNDLRAFDVYWAALRSGMYVTAINHHLTAPETNFILDDCGAKALFALRTSRPPSPNQTPSTGSPPTVDLTAGSPGAARYRVRRL